ALVVDLAVVIAALLAGEELERLPVRADGIEALLRLGQRDLLVALAVQHQERTGDLLHHPLKLEWLQQSDRLFLAAGVQHPRDMPGRDRERRRHRLRRPLEALAPD